MMYEKLHSEFEIQNNTFHNSAYAIAILAIFGYGKLSTAKRLTFSLAESAPNLAYAPRFWHDLACCRV